MKRNYEIIRMEKPDIENNTFFIDDTDTERQNVINEFVRSRITEKIKRLPDFQIVKCNMDQKVIFGWASAAALMDATRNENRNNGMNVSEDWESVMHAYASMCWEKAEQCDLNIQKKARMIESVILTKEKMRVLGIPEGTVQEGWWIGLRVDDDVLWEKMNKGILCTFTIEKILFGDNT